MDRNNDAYLDRAAAGAVRQAVRGEYRSRLSDWYGRAAVRTRPRHMFVDEAAENLVYFPPELVPVAGHPLVKALGPEAERRMLIRALHLYLSFTVVLEHGVVSRVCQNIAHGGLGPDVAPAMSMDAYAIYCDEAYHALFSADMRQQVADATGIAPDLGYRPTCLSQLDTLVASLPDSRRPLTEMVFCIVSETLISGVLRQLPRDVRVMSAIRLLVADHAFDEGWHHAYFVRVMKFLWPRLDTADQRALGVLIPQFIESFLSPDLAAVASSLAAEGLPPEQVRQVLAEVYTTEQAPDLRGSARRLLQLCEGEGLFADEQIADAFRHLHLID